MEPQNKIVFLGSGGDYFLLLLGNMVLTFLTLGFYYPWARANQLRYLYQNTEFDSSRFTFHGTGREMFIGFIKAMGILIVLYGGYMAALLSKNPAMNLPATLVFVMGLLFLIPIALHGRMRYRLSRTSWRGILFGYRGQLSTLLRKFLAGSFLSIITFGIYGFWFTIDLRKYILNNIRMGNVRFSYHGTGTEYLLLNLKGLFLSFLTLGIYFFWYQKELLNYYIEKTQIHQDENTYSIRSALTGADFLKLMLVNFFLIIFTLGLGMPWAQVRTLRVIFEKIQIPADFNTSQIRQTETEYTDATGEDLANLLDIGAI